MDMKKTLLAAAFFASVGTQAQAQGAVSPAKAEPAVSWTRVKVRLGKPVRKPASVRSGEGWAQKNSRCCGNCGTCGVRG